jgi:dienelactone hydrolase
VEEIRADGEASVIYATGDDAPPSDDQPRSWKRYKATLSNDTLTIATTFTATYRLAASGTLTAIFQRDEERNNARLSRIDLGDLMQPGATIPWTSRTAEFIDTPFSEDGKPIRLEVVLFRPRGDGPFPLLVFNHGSTGTGTEPAVFSETRWSFAVADFFNERGWMVAFPQRRGRGKSDGLYDEGFESDRARGYSCDSGKVLAGATRALEDIEVAAAALQRRPDVAGPLLMGGVSRGGVLSVAYAGNHRGQVAGVVNFVGGWTGEGCDNARELNAGLFRRGAKYARPTLWLYGRNDYYYTMEHSLANFDIFKKAGGKGEFFQFDVPAGNGHALNAYPEIWSAPLEKYVAQIGAEHKR